MPQTDAEAAKWYRLAADQGDADAQINLGGMYHNGRGVPQNDAEAVKWFRLAGRPRAVQSRLQLRQWPGRSAEPRRGAEVVSPRRRPRQRQLEDGTIRSIGLMPRVLPAVFCLFRTARTCQGHLHSRMDWSRDFPVHSRRPPGSWRGSAQLCNRTVTGGATARAGDRVRQALRFRGARSAAVQFRSIPTSLT